MMKILMTMAIIIVSAGLASGQKGSAESDYYPLNYHGETWTGEVTTINSETREITLTYTKKDKTQTFIGVLEPHCQVPMRDGNYQELKLSDLPKGIRLKVYYIGKEEKTSAGKVMVNRIFRARFLPKADK
jgi:hypothetical protein